MQEIYDQYEKDKTKDNEIELQEVDTKPKEDKQAANDGDGYNETVVEEEEAPKQDEEDKNKDKTEDNADKEKDDEKPKEEEEKPEADKSDYAE
eukprot:CAMPEP_0201568012 /NCGR_PEP_ID=MMETSP0190_2-20130828/8838_1 /ASSEMBLY_ACC=CAM_ASM_000263 /TAXON_ID=37353 /ORGANISM="Rosalina sp." /LENGTH=92 /DNA_ID=CAMNT_0047988663 /DNA_START=33 /DNA_END=311 /DNA_ORIENTATION=-